MNVYRLMVGAIVLAIVIPAWAVGVPNSFQRADPVRRLSTPHAADLVLENIQCLDDPGVFFPGSEAD
jgi:hypothetical protein